MEYENERDIVKYRTQTLYSEHRRNSKESRLSQLLHPRNPALSTQDLDIIYESSAHQVSWIKLRSGLPVAILPNGTELPGESSLITSGYWYWDSADEWLPVDYEPPVD